MVWVVAIVALVYYSMSSNTGTRNLSLRGPHEFISKGKNSNDLNPLTSPLLIFTFQRADYLERSLTEIFENIPTTCHIGCPVIISQDGDIQAVTEVIKSFQSRYKNIPVIHLKHKKVGAGLTGYQALGTHYQWGLSTTFAGIENYPKPERLIILEEDLLISHDFFDYFANMAHYLDKDESLLAVSAFNDNGKNGLVKDPSRVLRSDFFPGLGWMMTRKLYESELSSKWPDSYWDDWLREPVQRKGRHILRPEVSRTYHFGVLGGASGNQFGNTLGSIHLNEENVDWSKIDLSYLEPRAFDKSYFSSISTAQPADDINSALKLCKIDDVRLEYKSLQKFIPIAGTLGIMNDEKAGILRTAYRGVVEIRPYGEFILFLIPSMKELETTFNS